MSDHRCDRLLERYGLIMSTAAVDALLPLCTPKNRLQRGVNGDVHFIHHQGFDLVPVVREFWPGHSVIVTFLAPDHFAAGRRSRDMSVATGKAGKSAGWLRERQLRNRRLRCAASPAP
jgi:hypothetical protein